MRNYITTEELKQEIENLGFSVRVDYRLMEVTSPVGDTLAKMSKVQTHLFSVFYSSFVVDTAPELQEKLYDLLDRYARTPIEKREEQKKYRLRLDIDKDIKSDSLFLSKYDDHYELSVYYDSLDSYYCQEFTQAEIDEMGDLTKGFVKEEVCEN